MDEEIFIGSLLGDGCLIKTDCSYREKHSWKQKEYLKWKNRYLGFNYRETKDYCEIYKGDKVLFKKYRSFIYPDDKKRISSELLNKLTVKGLAIWFLDDGSYNYRSNNSRIATCCFNYDEHKKMIEFIKQKFNIECNIGKTYNKKYKKYYLFLTFDSENTKKLINLITSFVPECMNYKLGKDKVKSIYSKNKVKEYLNNHRIESRGYTHKWASKNRIKIKEYYLKNKERICKYRRKYYLLNKKKAAELQKSYIKRPEIRKHRAELALKYYHEHKK